MEGTLAYLAAAGVFALLPTDAAEAELSADIHAHELRAHVYRLASPEFLGRSGPGAARASRHLADAFRRLGLKPAFGDSYFQPIPARPGAAPGTASFVGRNVAAVLPGADPALAGQWVLLGAHFDHLGKRGGVLHPGADDNATGVAMLLEVAEHFALCGKKPRRTLVFAAFDQEEQGLLGSKHFAGRPPLPLAGLKAAVTADMLGRSMANVMDEYVFVLGSECSPGLRRLVAGVAPPRGLAVGRLGADVIGTRSDYGPFRDRKVPFLFLSTGQHPDYHQPTDTPDRVDYRKLQRVSVWVRDLVRRLADEEEAPAWAPQDLGHDLEEMRTVAVLVRRVLGRPDLYPLSEKDRALVEGVERRLAAILRRGEVNGLDRVWLVLTARLLMETVF
jgi:Peptidase family M28